MATTPEVSRDSVIILYKGGRLPTWHDLAPEAQHAYQQEHVDLMLSVAREHGLMRLEGFKLMTPQDSWERFWVIEFPTLAGTEAWSMLKWRRLTGATATTNTTQHGIGGGTTFPVG